MTLAPRPLDPDAIRRALHGRLGSPLLYLAETDSTNAQMLALAPAQRRHGTVVITDHQTAGRGRLDRTWIAPPCSSLLFSVALAWPDGVPPAQSVMLAALAVGDAVSWAVEASVQLKWPNDVLIEGKKVCGILGETASGGAGQTVVLGIGLNVNFDPADVPGIPADATSLQRAARRPIERERLFVKLVEALEMWYRGLTGNRAALFAAWSSRLGIAGQQVSVRDSAGCWDGTAVAVRPDGGLLVRADGGEERLVYAADVSVRSRKRDFTRQ